MDISQLLSNGLGKQVIEGISKQAGITEEETNSVVSAATPILLGMLKNNASSPEGAASLLGALGNHKGGILENLGSFLNTGNTSEGNGILEHILGNKRSTVESQLSESTGVSAVSVSKILALLAPIIMGQLGQKANSKDVSSPGGLSDMLGGLLGGADSSSLGGNILGNILGGMTSGDQKSGSLGDIIGGLGGLFGKK